MNREPAAFVALTLSACTTVTTVRVTPEQLQALADMGPKQERRFDPANEPVMVARGDDDVRILVAPIEAGWEKTPSVTQAPWGKLHTLRCWGSFATLAPTERGGELSVPLQDVTGGQVRMDRYSGEKTAALVGIILGTVAFVALTVAVIVLLNSVSTSLIIAGGG
jgi:hypothetical protein